VQTFATARDAKEFLVNRITTEAQREGVPLSETEREMLYFSETAWTLPDIADVNEAFDRDYDQARFEEKIGTLVRNSCAESRKNIELTSTHGRRQFARFSERTTIYLC
jgi:hypothetical protein